MRIYPSDNVKALFKNTRDLLKKTYVELVIGGIIGLGFALYQAHNHNLEAAKTSQLGYSDIEVQMYDMDESDRSKAVLTEFTGNVNDVCMTVFDAHNQSYIVDPDFPNQAFAKILSEEFKRRSTSTYYHVLPENIQTVEKLSPIVNDKIAHLSTAQTEAKRIVTALENTWSYSHTDHTETEKYIDKVCETVDSIQVCNDIEKEREVYSHTSHYFYYDESYGDRSDVLLSQFFNKHPDISLDEELILITEVSLHNKNKIENSIGQSLSDDRHREIANLSRTNSPITLNMPKIEEAHSDLSDFAVTWSETKDIAANEGYYSYTTYTEGSSHSGPPEYQMVQDAINEVKTLLSNAEEITESIAFIQRELPLLERDIKAYIKDERDGATEEQLAPQRESIKSRTDNIYFANVKDGLNVNPYSYLLMALYGFLGAAGGVGVGAVWNRYNDKKFADFEL